jgi:hypothetical protein
VDDYFEHLTIENEIVTTLRYLQRNGYAEDEKLTLVAAGFSDEFNNHSFESINIANIIVAPTIEIDTRVQLQSYGTEFLNQDFWLTTFLRKLFNIPSMSYQKGFAPRSTLSQRMAYWAPFICRKIILPLCICLCVVLFTYASKNKLIRGDISTIISAKDALFEKTGDEKQRLLAFNFDAFKDLRGQSPLPFLKTLAQSISKETHFTRFSWDATNKNNHWSYAFEATITMPEHSISLKSKRKNGKSIYSYQQKIQKKVQRNYPNATVIWLPTLEKTAYVLGVSWD